MTEILRYTAFSTVPEGGNPAGVVLDASGLSPEDMLRVAAEVGYSETAFVVGSRVRYFSPAMEIPFCGHATVATAVALAERDGDGVFSFETAAGTVPVEVSDGRATLTSVPASVSDVDGVEDAMAALDWRLDDLDPAFPPRVAFAGARHLVLAARTRERLAALDYDFEALRAWMTARDLVTVQLVWRESATVFHCRDPFPVGGVVEDPATGAAAAALGAYLREFGLVSPDAVVTLHQGEDMGRPSLIEVTLTPGDPRVRVTGHATRL